MRISPLIVAIGLVVFSLSEMSAKPAVPTVDLAQYGTADLLWDYIASIDKQKTRKSPKDLANLNAAAAAFLEKYPTDKRHWVAKLVEAQTGTPPDRDITVAEEILAAADAPPEVKQRAAFFLLVEQLKKLRVSESDPAGSEQVQKFDQALAAYAAQYPTDKRVDGVKASFAKELDGTAETEKAIALYKEVAAGANPDAAKKAKAILMVKDMVGKPVDLKFTAVDGQEVDLSKLRGKVVLIDFWATWCGPCMSGMPEVLDVYAKNRDKGFEIVGISLDTSKEKLLAVTKEKGMSWPQYFDGKGWDNELSTGYGINSIPRMWLINKKGELVDTLARKDLPAKVEKLLAE